jgi:transketolase
MANALRALAMDAVEAAKSGHPGMPMGMADVAAVLFSRFLKFDPTAPEWADRDRFILSADHGSMLLYGLLHLTGYADMTIEEIRRFRQRGARTAGHPEYGHASGIEMTTGPLGQGIATAVGMALAERMMAARFGDDLVDHHTNVIAGDGCLMEGISHEAASLAGHLGLGKLILLFDDNGISIDGPTSITLSDDVPARFAALQWHVQSVDGHDADAVSAAIAAAKADPRPSMIACRTVIGFGAPNRQGSEGVHGAPLGEAEIAAARAHLGWNWGPFEIPPHIAAAWRDAGARGAATRAAWEAGLAVSARANEFRRALDKVPGPEVLLASRRHIEAMVEKAPPLATRKSGEAALAVLTEAWPSLIGGSADLTHSNNTVTKSTPPVRQGAFAGRYIHWGVREHAMAAAMNGLSLHGGFRPYGGTFMVCSDYCRHAIRLSALMEQPVIYVFTHDSIGLGEDGPTHQPIEHLASLRAMPNLIVLRPADAVETAEAWQVAICQTHTPSVLVLSRQNLPTLRRMPVAENLTARGAYVIHGNGQKRDVTILATGSEVSIAVKAAETLAAQGIHAAVVSMPSWELFERQGDAYRQDVLGTAPRIAVEADVIAMRSFGASAPAAELYAQFGITAETIADLARLRAAGSHTQA